LKAPTRTRPPPPSPHRNAPARSDLTIRPGPVAGLRWSPPDSRNRRSACYLPSWRVILPVLFTLSKVEGSLPKEGPFSGRRMGSARCLLLLQLLWNFQSQICYLRFAACRISGLWSQVNLTGFRSPDLALLAWVRLLASPARDATLHGCDGARSGRRHRGRTGERVRMCEHSDGAREIRGSNPGDLNRAIASATAFKSGATICGGGPKGSSAWLVVRRTRRASTILNLRDRRLHDGVCAQVAGGSWRPGRS